MAAVVPVAAAYARFPGQATNDALDFTTEKDMKFFMRATAGLTNKFDLQSMSVPVFLQKVMERVMIFNLLTIIKVPTIGPTPVERNLILSYGTVTLEECRAFATTYLAANDRRSQNSAMLYQFLSDSLTEEASATLLTQTEKYTINGEKDGVCFLKVIISKAQVDTVTTVNALRTSISNLDNKMRDIKGNVKDFHTYVRQVTNTLAAYAERHDELLVNLFKAYNMVDDEEFRQYIRSKRHAYEDGGQLNENLLMTYAENHYNARIESGTWKAAEKKSERIIAMETELKQWRNGQKGKAPQDRAKNDAKWAWKKVPPKDGEPKHMVHQNGNTYHWCPNHGWSIHTPDKCYGMGKRADGTAIANSSMTNTPVMTTRVPEGGPPTLKIDPALESLVWCGGVMIP